MYKSFGAAGREVLDLDLMRHARRHFSAQHLDIDDQSAESFFHTTWAYRISVANMRGTAAIIYNVPRGETVPARYKRPTKEDQHRLATLSGRRPFRGRPRESRNHPRSPRPPHTHSSSDSSSDGCESPVPAYPACVTPGRGSPACVLYARIAVVGCGTVFYS